MIIKIITQLILENNIVFVINIVYRA